MKPVPLCNGQGGRIKDDRVSELASLRNQENQPGVNDLASLKNQPQTNTNLPQNGYVYHCILHIVVYSLNSRLRSNRGLATRLNFSDSESSFGASAVNSLLEDSVGGRVSVLGHSQVYVHVRKYFLCTTVCIHVRLSVAHCRSECLYTLDSTKSCPLSIANTCCGCVYLLCSMHASHMCPGAGS